MTAAPHTRPECDPVTGRATWAALGTYVELTTVPPVAVDAAAAVAAHVLHEVDAACSRFRPDSELSRVCSAAGAHLVSPVLAGALRVALEAAEATGGVVDPTLGEVLVQAGYDRTFTRVPAVSPDPAAVPVPRSSWRAVTLDEETVTVPPHVGLDLGATGKGYAADLVVATVTELLGVSVCVSVGGDVRTSGRHVETWPVTLAATATDHAQGRRHALLELPSGLGLATSSTRARAWQRGGQAWHHIVDPRTGRPATGPWRTVTALGHTAAAANAASTAAVVLGDDAHAWLASRGIAALLVAGDGTTISTPAWAAAHLTEASAA